MILTVTLNPAVDKTCEVNTLVPGEVNRLLKSTCVAGGKGVNVAKILRQFHIPVAAVGFLGGRSGEMIESALEEMGVENYFTKIAKETRTNVNVLALDGTVTELLEPGPDISEKELKEFHKQFTGCLEHCEIVVLSGSAPMGVPTNIYAKLTEECHRYGCRVFLDASGELLKKGISAKPDYIKPNKKELEYLADRELNSLGEIKAEMRKLLGLGVGKVFLSLGAEGLLCMDGEKEIFEPARKIQPVNTVGCGDTVVASLCMSELAFEDEEIALQKASALAAANALVRENGKFSMKDYLELL